MTVKGCNLFFRGKFHGGASWKCLKPVFLLIVIKTKSAVLKEIRSEIIYNLAIFQILLFQICQKCWNFCSIFACREKSTIQLTGYYIYWSGQPGKL